MLTPKNVHALRTLFNVAHRLHHLLGPAWVLVLDILNTLDRILLSPRTTTQVHACKSGASQMVASQPVQPHVVGKSHSTYCAVLLWAECKWTDTDVWRKLFFSHDAFAVLLSHCGRGGEPSRSVCVILCRLWPKQYSMMRKLLPKLFNIR